MQSYSKTWVLVNVLSIPLASTWKSFGSNSSGHSVFDQKEITESVKSLVTETEGAMILGYFSAKQAQKGHFPMFNH